MELHTLTLKLVAPIGSGSKITSTQTQELQQRAVMQLNNALIQMFALMVASSPMVIMMAALSMQDRHLGVENTTLKSTGLWKCAALVMVAIALANKMEETM